LWCEKNAKERGARKKNSGHSLFGIAGVPITGDAQVQLGLLPTLKELGTSQVFFDLAGSITLLTNNKPGVILIYITE
jgi:hypothetical protein